MSDKDKTQVFQSKQLNPKNKKKKRNNNPNYYGIILTIILIIPFLVFGIILSIDFFNGDGKTNRFKDELVYKINDQQINEIKSQFNYCVRSEINLKSATLRISCEPSEQSDISQVANKIYQTVSEVLPIEKYFTNQESTKMYDLEIYTYLNLGKENQTIYLITKNASGEKIEESLTDAKDPELAKSLLNPQADEKE